jgi:branched-chain amino acid transport system substrate-binding protein
MYEIGPYKGLIKTYEKPFTPESHDALSENDYVMVRYKGEHIVPVK